MSPDRMDPTPGDPTPADATPADSTPGDLSPPGSERPAALMVIGVILCACLISMGATAVLTYFVHENAKAQHEAATRKP